eukprot:Polyplicarium_translucidae@DN1920_c0_g1_i2.p1
MKSLFGVFGGPATAEAATPAPTDDSTAADALKTAEKPASAVDDTVSQARADVGGDGSSIAKLEDAETSSIDVPPPAGDTSSESPKSRDVECNAPTAASREGSAGGDQNVAPDTHDEAAAGASPAPGVDPPKVAREGKAAPVRGAGGRQDAPKAGKSTKTQAAAGEYVSRILGSKDRTAGEIESENRKLRAELIGCRRSLVASQDALGCYSEAIASIAAICAGSPANALTRIESVIDDVKMLPLEGASHRQRQRRSGRKKLWKRVSSTTPQSETPQSAFAERRRPLPSSGGQKGGQDAHGGRLPEPLFHSVADGCAGGSDLNGGSPGRTMRKRRTNRARRSPQMFGPATPQPPASRIGRAGRRMPEPRPAAERAPEEQGIGESVRASLRSAETIEALSGVIKRAKGAGLTYEADLGQKKLDKLATKHGMGSSVVAA